MKQTAGVIAQLKGLDSTWDRLTGDAQQRANSERQDKLEKQQARLRQGCGAADGLIFTGVGWERDGLEVALGKLDVQLKGGGGEAVEGAALPEPGVETPGSEAW